MKHFVLLFLDMVFHVLGQHLDLGIEHFAVGLHTFDLGDQCLQAGMLDGGFGHQLLVFQRLLERGIKNLFLYLVKRAFSYSANRLLNSLWSARGVGWRWHGSW